MTARKKPIGVEWDEFVENWRKGNHEHKLQQCALYGITYDTAKHWINEGDTTPLDHPRMPNTKIEETALAVGEVLALRSKIDLDFVTYDIETTGLKADFSIMLSAVIKPFKQEPIVFRADDYEPWKEGHRLNDQEICRDITNELSRHAIIITHYGVGFDIPYTRAKMIRYGLPPLPPMFGVDTYSLAKANMLVSRRRLEALAEYLSLGKKTAVEGNLWMEAAMNGDKAAMDKIVEHNIQDCVLLEKLAAITFPYLKSLRRL